ncbi:hypothetical protein D020_0061B, partial [Vibrio parahaemolyticus SBR10290]
QFIFQ